MEWFQNNDETCEIKELVKEHIENVLTAPRQLLRLALASMIESRKNPSMFQACISAL